MFSIFSSDPVKAIWGNSSYYTVRPKGCFVFCCFFGAAVWRVTCARQEGGLVDCRENATVPQAVKWLGLRFCFSFFGELLFLIETPTAEMFLFFFLFFLHLPKKVKQQPWVTNLLVAAAATRRRGNQSFDWLLRRQGIDCINFIELIIDHL